MNCKEDERPCLTGEGGRARPDELTSTERMFDIVRECTVDENAILDVLEFVLRRRTQRAQANGGLRKG
jgi:hypothetical protein